MAEGTPNSTGYEIKIKGHLDRRWAEWFDGLTITHESDGTTTLSGQLADQTALHSVLLNIRNLNLALISLNPVKSDAEREQGQRDNPDDRAPGDAWN